jgi:hypothetical protein
MQSGGWSGISIAILRPSFLDPFYIFFTRILQAKRPRTGNEKALIDGE